MKKFPKAAVFATLLASALAACDQLIGPGRLAPYRDVGGSVVGTEYRAWEARERSEGKEVHATAYIKLVNVDGRLGVCGAYVYDGSDDLFSAIPTYFKSPLSYLAISPAHAPTIHLRTYALAEDDLHFMKLDSHGPFPATCVVTDIAWQDEYLDAPLEFHLSRAQGSYSQGARDPDPTDLIWIPLLMRRH